MNLYDPEKTSIAISQSGGRSLDPLTMVHEDLRICFEIVGKHKEQADIDAKEQAKMVAEIINLKESLDKLTGRLWAMLVLFITEGVAAGAAFLFS